MVDTCSSASIIHHVNNPTQDRIFKIRGRRTYYLPCQGDVNWRESSNDMELTLARGNMTQEMNDDELFWSSSDDDEDDDIILDMTSRLAPASKEEEETYYSDSDEENSSISESVTSEKIRVHMYLDDVVFYEDVNEQTTCNCYGGLIDTDVILDDLLP